MTYNKDRMARLTRAWNSTQFPAQWTTDAALQAFLAISPGTGRQQHGLDVQIDKHIHALCLYAPVLRVGGNW